MRLAVPEELSLFIAAGVAGFSVEAPEQLLWESSYVADISALPLYVGWTETIGIRSDGEIVSWSTEGDYLGVRPVEDRILVLIALVTGVQRYPELRALLPERPSDATDCPCRNHALLASGSVLCGQCGGIGWLPGKPTGPGVAPNGNGVP
jgi:hypothetical protein